MVSFPDSTNTGVPPGTTLTTYTGPLTIKQNGTVIDGKIINGSLRIEADNVVIKNCRITFDDWQGIDAENAKNTTVQHCDIIGPGFAGDSNAGILGKGNFLRNDIRKAENGITLTDGASKVIGNYIHDLQDSGADPHYDGLSVQGGQHGVLIEDNTIIAKDTSAILICNDFGPVSDVTVRGNFLGGDPGYVIYVTGDKGGTHGVSITDNYIVQGYYGNYYIVAADPVISNNKILPANANPADYIGGGASPGGGPADHPTRSTDDNPGDSAGGSSGGSAGSNSGGEFTGASGNDVLPATGQSNSGNEKFFGQPGNDMMRGGAGADHIDGGSGIDTARYDGSNAAVYVRLDKGTGSGGYATGDTLVNVENLAGSSHNDKLFGNAGSNVIDGGGGADYMAGGKGNDTYIIDNGGDATREDAKGGGWDMVRTSVDYKLLSNIEELVLTGTGNLNGAGNTGANVLRGNSGNNALNGHNGNDVIYSGLGNDTLTGGYQKDVFVFDTALSASNNVDRITDFSVGGDVIHLDNAVFTELTDGTLASSAFVKNTTGVAQDSNDHIIYETDTGELFYDSNGSASGGSVHFATLNAHLNLTSADFVVI